MQVIKKKFRKDRVFLIIMIFVFIVILVFSLTKIKTWLKDRNNNNEVIDKITEEVKIDKIKDDDNTELINSDKEEKTSDYWYYVNFPLINVDFNNLKKINDETVGWINVNNTNINYPFVRSRDNDYYLSHSYDKTYNNAGWVFMDYRNNRDLNNKNTILYAHGRMDKTMFGSLYMTQYSSWYQNKSNHIIRISTELENTLWQVFSVYKIEEESYYIKTDFSNDTEFNDFLTTIKNRSKYDFNTELTSSDKILTLSTCANDKERYVVHAKLIKKSAREQLKKIKEINYEVLESMGLLDYYFDLSKFIHNFINKNYPLNEEDIRCLSANETTPNIEMRNEMFKVMNEELLRILEYQKRLNQKFMIDLENQKEVKPINIGEYNKEIFNYKEQLLKARYEYLMENETKRSK